MGKNLDSKCKQCRRIGEKLFLKGDRCSSPKCAMVKRSYPPGFHGPKQTRKRSTDYGLQLTEKQKAKKIYGLTEKQFRISFDKVQGRGGEVGDNFLRYLESRLDNVIYRAGFADSRAQARQIVNHGHFMIDDKKAAIPSHQVKPGQVITVKKKALNSKYFRDLLEKLKNPKDDQKSWLAVDTKKLSIKILHEPRKQDLPSNIKTNMIIEFYSK
jgi:small subunit ribosomal protein S4